MAKFIAFEDSEEFNGQIVNIEEIAYVVQDEDSVTAIITMKDGTELEVPSTVEELMELMAKQVAIHVG